MKCLYLECSHRFLQSALCCMVNQGEPGSTKVLQLRVEDERVTTSHNLLWPRDLDYDATSPESLAEFLSPVQYLQLWNNSFHWHSPAYHGLIELTLSLRDGPVTYITMYPTQRQMAKILSSCPRLHTLSLDMAMLCRDRQTTVELISLDDLQFLTLQSKDSSGCLGILSLIAPGTKALHVNLSVHSDAAFMKGLRSFFRRSNVTSLQIKAIKGLSWFKPLSRKFSQLEHLVLDDCNFRDQDLLDFFDLPSTRASPWPKLRTLELIGCQIDKNTLDQLISSKVRTIKLYDGSVFGLTSRVGVAVDGKGRMRELEQRLRSTVPDTEYFPYRPFID